MAEPALDPNKLLEVVAAVAREAELRAFRRGYSDRSRRPSEAGRSASRRTRYPYQSPP